MTKLSEKNYLTHLYKQKSCRPQRKTYDNLSPSNNLSDVLARISSLILLIGNACLLPGLIFNITKIVATAQVAFITTMIFMKNIYLQSVFWNFICPIYFHFTHVPIRHWYTPFQTFQTSTSCYSPFSLIAKLFHLQMFFYDKSAGILFFQVSCLLSSFRFCLIHCQLLLTSLHAIVSYLRSIN